MDHSIIIEIYLANIRIGVKRLGKEILDEIDVRNVVNSEYHKLREDFDKEILPKLTEEEIEEFFETLNFKTDEIVDSVISKK